MGYVCHGPDQEIDTETLIPNNYQVWSKSARFGTSVKRRAEGDLLGPGSAVCRSGRGSPQSPPQRVSDRFAGKRGVLRPFTPDNNNST